MSSPSRTWWSSKRERLVFSLNLRKTEQICWKKESLPSLSHFTKSLSEKKRRNSKEMTDFKKKKRSAQKSCRKGTKPSKSGESCKRVKPRLSIFNQCKCCKCLLKNKLRNRIPNKVSCQLRSLDPKPNLKELEWISIQGRGTVSSTSKRHFQICKKRE